MKPLGSITLCRILCARQKIDSSCRVTIVVAHSAYVLKRRFKLYDIMVKHTLAMRFYLRTRVCFDQTNGVDYHAVVLLQYCGIEACRFSYSLFLQFSYFSALRFVSQHDASSFMYSLGHVQLSFGDIHYIYFLYFPLYSFVTQIVLHLGSRLRTCVLCDLWAV